MIGSLPDRIHDKRRLLMKLFFFLLVASSSLSIYAQTTLSGTVVSSDNNEPLPGVTISILGTTKGTITDFDGKYTLQVSEGETLEYRFIGFISQSIVVDGRTVIDVSLEENVRALDEVLVIGYGQSPKKEVTGAVARVDAETLVKNATPDIATALQGQIAGVSVQASSGEPGAPANIRIRGTGSSTGFQGSSDPLYVIDGIPYPQGVNPNLSPNEIESIDVLKDAASAAIYGVKGASGVILITTKQGEKGVFQISLDSWAGVQSITSGTPLLNAEGQLYRDFVNVFNRTPGLTWETTFTRFENNRFDLTNNSEVLSLIENDNAPITNHSVTVSGGEKNLTYNISGSYFYQDGSIVNSDYQRFNLRSNTTFKKNKWTVHSGIGLRREDRTYAPFQFLLDGIRYNPLQAPINPNASTIENPGSNEDEEVATGGLVAKLKRDDTSDENHLNGYLQVENEITDGLKVSTRLGASTTDFVQRTIFPLFQRFDQETGELLPQTSETRSRVQNLSRTQTTWAWENIVNYSKEFGEHQLDVTGVFSADNVTYNQFLAQKFDLASNEVTVLNAATEASALVNSFSDDPFNRNRVTNTIGILGRAKYTFRDGKYVVSAAVRRDGSSRFVPQTRWLTSPSISMAWNVADEGFFNPLLNVFSSFKIRGGWGRIGNQSIPDYGFQATISTGVDNPFGTGTSEVLGVGLTQQGFANPFVQWETKTEINVGADVGFFGDKLLLEANVYQDDRTDLLAFLTPPASSGSEERITRNIGDLTNKGIELTASYRRAGTFNWTISANFTKNINEVTSLPSDAGTISFFDDTRVVQQVPGEQDVVGLQEGHPAFSYFLYQNLGVIKDSATLQAYQDSHDVARDARLGDLMYADVNGDGILDARDRVASGNVAPDFEVGFNVDLSYKGFDFSMQWFGAFGVEVINGSRAYAYKLGRHEELLYAWTP
ncbi:MAG: SusC/RagA family TonB-linked outer membrane protein, partial [Bacteroidota bacterium]